MTILLDCHGTSSWNASTQPRKTQSNSLETLPVQPKFLVPCSLRCTAAIQLFKVFVTLLENMTASCATMRGDSILPDLLLTKWFLLVLCIGFSLFRSAPSLHAPSRYSPTTRRWKMIMSDSSTSANIPETIQLCEFSGIGDVLLAYKGEYDHYLMEAAVLIYEHGERGSAGVVLDKPSAFTMGEMVPNIGPFKGNTLFQGGADGQDSVLMFHSFDLGGLAKPLGSSGLYVGGLKEAREKLERFEGHPRDFKFVYNNVQWLPGALEEEIEMGRWTVCRIPPELVLKQEASAFGTLWKRARTVLKVDTEEERQEAADD